MTSCSSDKSCCRILNSSLDPLGVIFQTRPYWNDGIFTHPYFYNSIVPVVCLTTIRMICLAARYFSQAFSRLILNRFCRVSCQPFSGFSAITNLRGVFCFSFVIKCSRTFSFQLSVQLVSFPLLMQSKVLLIDSIAVTTNFCPICFRAIDHSSCDE